MSVQVAPLTHRCLLHRSTCPRCKAETLHKAFTCLNCGHRTIAVIIKRKAFGARLVLTRKPRP